MVDSVDSDVAIYLHWNGGRDTVEPVLEVAKEYGLTGDNAGMNDLYKMFHNMLATDMAETAYVGRVEEYNGSASGDNGVYIIDKSFNIIDRLDFENEEQQIYLFEDIYDWTRKENDKYFKRRKEHINLINELKTALLLLDGQPPNKWSQTGKKQVLESVVLACNQYMQED
jgi:hypothetical protein